MEMYVLVRINPNTAEESYEVVRVPANNRSEAEDKIAQLQDGGRLDTTAGVVGVWEGPQYTFSDAGEPKLISGNSPEELSIAVRHAIRASLPSDWRSGLNGAIADKYMDWSGNVNPDSLVHMKTEIQSDKFNADILGNIQLTDPLSAEQAVKEDLTGTGGAGGTAEATMPQAMFRNFLQQRYGTGLPGTGGGFMPAGTGFLQQLGGFTPGLGQIASGFFKAKGQGDMEAPIAFQQFLEQAARTGEKHGRGLFGGLGRVANTMLRNIASSTHPDLEIFQRPGGEDDPIVSPMRNLATMALGNRMGAMGARRFAPEISQRAVEDYFQQIAAGSPLAEGENFAQFMRERTRSAPFSGVDIFA